MSPRKELITHRAIGGPTAGSAGLAGLAHTVFLLFNLNLSQIAEFWYAREHDRYHVAASALLVLSYELGPSMNSVPSRLLRLTYYRDLAASATSLRLLASWPAAYHLVHFRPIPNITLKIIHLSKKKCFRYISGTLVQPPALRSRQQSELQRLFLSYPWFHATFVISRYVQHVHSRPDRARRGHKTG